MALAALLERASLRVTRAVAVAVLLCVGSNLALLNQYMAQMISSGPTWIWSDAIFPLHRFVESRLDRFYCSVDWGIANQLRFLTKGRVRFLGREDGITLDFDTPQRDQVLERLFWDRRSSFIVRAEGARCSVAAGSDSFNSRKTMVTRGRWSKPFHDRHGSPVFEVWEFQR